MLKALQTILNKIEQNIAQVSSLFRIKNPKLRNLFSLLFFLATLHVFYSYIGVYRHIRERPCSIHASAQCQRASVAMNYYNIDMNFFEPRIQRFNNDDGITGLEFPIIYYSAAVLYKIFGFNDFYLRIISLLLITIGFCFLFMLINRFIRNALLSVIVTAAVILSPVLFYYGANFMPDAPSLGFTLVAWYFFFKFAGSGKNRDLNLFVFFGTLGALIKAVSAMFFIIIIALLVINRFRKFKHPGGEFVFARTKGVILRIFIGLFVVFLWYYYAKWLSEHHGNQAFAMVPVMIDDMESFHLVMKFLKNWTYQYYAKETYVLLISALAFVIIAFRKVNGFLLSIAVFYILGCICYAYLFFYQFAHHDYYFIAMMPCAFFLVLTFIDAVSRLSQKYSRIIMFLVAVILVFNIKECLWNCKENYAYRYDNREYLGGDYRPYYDIEPKLRRLGITRRDKIVSAFDESYSNSLYFMNQPGFTVEGVYQRDTILHSLNSPGVKYLVVNDSAKFNKIYKYDLSDKIVVIHRGLIVYKLK